MTDRLKELSRKVRRAVKENLVSTTDFTSEDATFILDLICIMKIESDGDQDQLNLLKEFTRKMLQLQIIDPISMKERLDPELLEMVSIIPSAQMFTRKQIRINTTMLYKQTKFNLMREESEGYSKLMTELTSGLASVPTTFQLTTNNDQNIQLFKLKVNETLRNMFALIGYFDMDPNRVFDIILDVFTANVVDYWRFFIDLLLTSPWKPQKLVSKDGQVTYKARSVCGQILGFKFTSFNRPTGSHSGKSLTTTNLYWVAAIMLQHNFIKFEDIYPHIGPDSKGLNSDYKEYLQEIAQKAKNAGRFVNIGLTGMLSDDGPPSLSTSNQPSSQASKTDSSSNKSADDDEKNHERSVKMNQKAGLAASLLALGDIENAFSILQEDLRLVSMYPEIADAMSTLLHVILDPLYNQVRLNTRLNDYFKLRKDYHGHHRAPTVVTHHKHAQFENVMIKGKKWSPSNTQFFYPTWRDHLPSCSSWSEFIPTLNRYLPLIGPHLHRDIRLLTKIVRLCKEHFKQQTTESQDVEDFYLTLVTKFFFPSLSLLDPNPSLVNEIFGFIKNFNYLQRFALYKEWRTKTYETIPELKIAKMGCMKDTRYIMRRLSKETIRQYGRHIGKVVHSNPAIAFSLIIDQLQSYDNQIPHVVEASRYMTDFEFDVLTFCLVEALSSSVKDRVQPSGTLIAKWLTNLSSLAGNLGRRHGIELEAILQNVSEQLMYGNIYDLVVIQELVDQMCGIKILDDTTDVQLEAFAGGEILRRESLMFENLRLIRKSSTRLTSALLESGLASQIAILMAQIRRDIVFMDEDARDLKIMAWRFDHCHKSFIQYISFLVSNVDKDSYPKLFKDLTDLCKTHHLQPEVAFYILRPKLERLMKKSITSDEPETDQNDSLVVVKVNSPSKMVIDIDTEEKASSDNQVIVIDEQEQNSPYHPTLIPVINSVKRVLPASITKTISAPFYVSFWQLSLYDIYLPKALYENEIAKFKTNVNRLQDEYSMETKNSAANKLRKERDRIQITLLSIEKEMLTQQLHLDQVNKRLEKEKLYWIDQDIPRSAIALSFLKECIYPRSLFSPEDAVFCAKFIFKLHAIGTKNWPFIVFLDKLMNQQSLEEKLFSLTENEAKNYGTFMTEVMKRLTKWHMNSEVYNKEAIGEGMTGFSRPAASVTPLATPIETLKPFVAEIDKTENGAIKGTVTATTDNNNGTTESKNGSAEKSKNKEVTGTSVIELISTNNSPKGEKPTTIITTETISKEPTAATDAAPSNGVNEANARKDTVNNDGYRPYEWDEFRRIMHKWHTNMRKAFGTCLESKEYMKTRNAIILLDRLRETFPLMRTYGEAIEKLVKHIEDIEERGDLKQLARSYYAKIQSLKGKWMSQGRFSPNSAPTNIPISSAILAASTSASNVKISASVGYSESKKKIVDTPTTSAKIEMIVFNDDDNEGTREAAANDPTASTTNSSDTTQKSSTRDVRIVKRNDDDSKGNKRVKMDDKQTTKSNNGYSLSDLNTKKDEADDKRKTDNKDGGTTFVVERNKEEQTYGPKKPTADTASRRGGKEIKKSDKSFDSVQYDKNAKDKTSENGKDEKKEIEQKSETNRRDNKSSSFVKNPKEDNNKSSASDAPSHSRKEKNVEEVTMSSTEQNKVDDGKDRRRDSRRTTTEDRSSKDDKKKTDDYISSSRRASTERRPGGDDRDDRKSNSGRSRHDRDSNNRGDSRRHRSRSRSRDNRESRRGHDSERDGKRRRYQDEVDGHQSKRRNTGRDGNDYDRHGRRDRTPERNRRRGDYHDRR